MEKTVGNDNDNEVCPVSTIDNINSRNETQLTTSHRHYQHMEFLVIVLVKAGGVWLHMIVILKYVLSGPRKMIMLRYLAT